MTCIRGDWEDRLPKIRIPLADDGPDVVLPLQFVLDQTTSMGQRLNYEQPLLRNIRHGQTSNSRRRGMPRPDASFAVRLTDRMAAFPHLVLR